MTIDEVEAARIKFARALREYTSAGNTYHDRAPLLPQKLLDNAQLIRDRHALLEYLPKHAVCAEIGTDRADFAARILDTCMPQKLVIFEIDISRIEWSNIEAAVARGQVDVVEGDSVTRLSGFKDGYFDWIYIDGDHYYEGVLRDMTIASKKIKEDGLIVLNDYTTWSPVGMTHCGVARAVNEFCIQNDFEIIYLAFQTMFYNDVAIRKLR